MLQQFGHQDQFFVAQTSWIWQDMCSDHWNDYCTVQEENALVKVHKVSLTFTTYG